MMTDFQMLVNQSIKELRKRTGLSQDKFCEKCGINTNNYRNLEYNRHMPNPETINKICDTFKLTPIELIAISLNTTPVENINNLNSKIKGLDAKQINILSGFIDVLLANK